MKAVVIKGDEARLVRDRPLPRLRDDYVLVKPYAVALNPTDWKHVAFRRAKDDALMGCDYAGVVEEVGPAVTKDWQKGDRICGCAHGSNAVNGEDGVFAEYAVVKGDVQMRIPDSLSYEDAATVPLSAITVGQGLYQKSLRLKLPTCSEKDSEYVLIYGGGTSTGGLAIQFAKLSGYTVITTCSENQFDRLKGLGADYCFPYTDPDTPSKIRRLTNNGLKYAWDTVSIESSAKICADSLSTGARTRYGTTNPIISPRDDVESSSVVMYTMFGEEFVFGPRTFAASPEDFEFAKMFMGLCERLLAEGKLKTHPVLVGDGGLAGVIRGLKDLQDGKVRSGKLVYRVGDTP
ncbi:zinc-binding oxidoreductase [Fonsecaea pedrosoi]|nr:zinc-binding oxidoreductase [Fonsecaea pedrosoi]